MHIFDCKTRIISGADALSWLRGRQCQRLLMVTDPYFRENGWAEKIAESVEAEKREIFDKVKPDPTVELAAEGTALMGQLKPDLLIALGGGSALDTAKAMMYFSKEKVTFVAIPTTSGSGSEVTNFSVLTHGALKHPLIDRCMQPDVAILAAELVEKLPPSLVADGGFDVLSHAAEAFVATKADAISRALAGSAFATVFGKLSASFRGDTRVRGEIHLASTMAGIAFSQAGLGMCHALSHSLGGIFHIPHGRLNAILLPAVIGCNAYAAGEKYAKMAQAAGLGGSAVTMGVRSLRNALVRLRRELDMPATLVEAGIRPSEVWGRQKELVAATLADPCCSTNPVPVEEFMVRKVLEEVTGRG